MAEHLLERDVDYVVAEGHVQLVDVPTGRIFADRSWQDGLQQAVEVKEGIAVSACCAAAARISRQRFYRQYQALCGTTGTATPDKGKKGEMSCGAGSCGASKSK